jgi:hypothetical protein
MAVMIAAVGATGGVTQGATMTANCTEDLVAEDGPCTLREAIINANNDDQSGSTDCAAGSGADTITFSIDGKFTSAIVGIGDDDAATGDLDINDDLTITGNGEANTIIDGNFIDRVFHILSGSTVSISGVTIQDGSPNNYSRELPTSGGGILNEGGTLTLTSSTIIFNTTTNGGGITNSSGTLRLVRSRVSSNTANGLDYPGPVSFGQRGGAILNLSGTMTLISSTISDNVADFSWGGGIANIINLWYVAAGLMFAGSHP